MALQDGEQGVFTGAVKIAIPAGTAMLNGAHCKRVGDTIFVALPRELWREIDGGCACRFCSASGKSVSPAYWDTLAIAANMTHDHAWTVHYPEYHGASQKRSHE